MTHDLMRGLKGLVDMSLSSWAMWSGDMVLSAFEQFRLGKFIYVTLYIRDQSP
jgi:hypothetical protein